MSELVQEGKLERGTELLEEKRAARTPGAGRKAVESNISVELFPLPCQTLLFACTKQSSRRIFLQFLLQLQMISDLLKPRIRGGRGSQTCSCPVRLDPPPSLEDPQQHPLGASHPSSPPHTLSTVGPPLSLHLPWLRSQTAPPTSLSDHGNRIQPWRKNPPTMCHKVELSTQIPCRNNFISPARGRISVRQTKNYARKTEEFCHFLFLSF